MMLNRSQSLYLSFLMFAVSGMHAAENNQLMLASSDAVGPDRSVFRFMYASGSAYERDKHPDCVGTDPIALSSQSSEPVREFDLTELAAGVPFINRYAQYPSWFRWSLSTTLGVVATSVAGGLYFKFTPEQVATFVKYVSLGSIAWGIGSQLYGSVRNTGTNSDYREERMREIRISQGYQMWQLMNNCDRALPEDLEGRIIHGSAEEIHNSNVLLPALQKILTDNYRLDTLCESVDANIKRRNYHTTAGYVAGGALGLVLAHSLKGLAQK